MARLTEKENRVRKRIFDQVLSQGTCPLVEEIASELSLSRSEMAEIFKALEASGCVAMSNPGHAGMKVFQQEELEEPTPPVGEIFYARPFSVFKNHYPIWVDGEQRWYAECAVEACAVWDMFPGREVVLRSVCRQTGEAVELIAREGRLVEYSPKTLRVHIGIPFRYFLDDLVGWCDYNSFFVSEEAVEEWSKAHPDVEGITRDPSEISTFFVNTIARGRVDYYEQISFPVLKVLSNLRKYGLTKPVTRLGFPVLDTFWIPTLHTLMELRRKGFKNYVRISLF